MTEKHPHYKLQFWITSILSPDEFPTLRNPSANVVGLNDLLARVRYHKMLCP